MTPPLAACLFAAAFHDRQYTVTLARERHAAMPDITRLSRRVAVHAAS